MQTALSVNVEVFDPWVHVVADYRFMPDYLDRLRRLAGIPVDRDRGLPTREIRLLWQVPSPLVD